MTIWVKDLTTRERRTLCACAGGWILDAFDLMIFSYIITGLLSIRMLTKPQAGVLATSALLVSSLGGWLAGVLCDRYGRVRVLQVTILWFAVFTFLCGFAQNYGQLLVLRSLQGLGFGGEWTAGSVLMGEVIRAKYRGRAGGTVQAGWGFGSFLSAIAYGVVFSMFSPQWSWRVLFWIGILPALLVGYVRRYVEEPDIFVKPSSQTKVELFGFLKGHHLITTIITVTMETGMLGGYYVLMIWLPQFLKGERGLTVIGTSGYTTLVQFGSFTGFLIGAHLADYIGRKKTVILFTVLAAFAMYAYTTMTLGPAAMMVLGFFVGIVSSGRAAPVGTMFTELYPTDIRGSAQGFVYNVGRAIGALSPTIVGYAAVHMKLGLAMGVLAVLTNGIVLCSVLLLPETRNKELTAVNSLVDGSSASDDGRVAAAANGVGTRN